MLEHARFFAAGLVVWLPVLETLPAPEWFGTGPKLAYIAGVRVVETVLGNVFVWSGTVFYPIYEAARSLGDLAPQDQARRRGDDDRGLARHDRRSLLALPPAREGELRQELLERGLDRAPSAVPCATAARRSLPAALNSEGHDALQRDPPRRSRRLVRRAEPALLP